MSTLPPRTLRTAEDLVHANLVEPERAAGINRIAGRYAVAISPHVAKLIDTGAMDDPIARQFVPDANELITLPEERADPIGDHAHSPVPGIVHRYPDRVLLKAVGICPVYCRFCFRREMVGPGAGKTLTEAELETAFNYIDSRSEIWEVIFTGGDPFALSPRRLRSLVGRLGAIGHVKVVRWHTRVPVVQPDLVGGALVDAIYSVGKTVIVAVHANHPRELAPEAISALKVMRAAGVMLVSQTVLLRGVNDSAAVLAELMRAFVEAGVKPYYLHHPDLAPGTAHFRVPIAQGQAIMRELRATLSGIAQPTYVLDIPGGFGKVPVGPDYIGDDGMAYVRDPAGQLHRYSG